MLKQFCILAAATILLASCKNNETMSSTNCATATDSLQREIAARDTRINGLLDSLKMMGSATTTTTTTTDTAMMASNNTNAPADKGASATKSSGHSLFKGTKTRKMTGSGGGKYPGQFPEGSAQMLTEKDVKFLSQWGLKVMLNEIYARHGMRFSDGEMRAHFDHEGWYKGTTDDVSGKLTPTEQHNVAYIKNYKFNPQITE